MTESHNDSAPAAWAALGPLMDLVTPMALRVAATLRIPDLVGDGAVSVDELAERSGTDADGLARLLRHLVAHGVFAEPEPGWFAAGGPARFLRSDHAAGMRAWLDLDGFGGRMDLAFTGLLHTVRTGKPAWATVFGKPFWQRANPGLRGTLVDLPDTVRRGAEYLAERGLDRRYELAGQSFFDPLPAGGDVYVLSGVVHDWPDEAAVAILRRCAEAAGDRGRVVVIEAHGAAGDDPATFAEMNLRMLVLAGGRERDLDDYRALVAASGLRVTDVATTPLGHILIECVTAPE